MLSVPKFWIIFHETSIFVFDKSPFNTGKCPSDGFIYSFIYILLGNVFVSVDGLQFDQSDWAPGCRASVFVFRNFRLVRPTVHDRPNDQREILVQTTNLQTIEKTSIASRPLRSKRNRFQIVLLPTSSGNSRSVVTQTLL